MPIYELMINIFGKLFT